MRLWTAALKPVVGLRFPLLTVSPPCWLPCRWSAKQSKTQVVAVAFRKKSIKHDVRSGGWRVGGRVGRLFTRKIKAGDACFFLYHRHITGIFFGDEVFNLRAVTIRLRWDQSQEPSKLPHSLAFLSEHELVNSPKVLWIAGYFWARWSCRDSVGCIWSPRHCWVQVWSCSGAVLWGSGASKKRWDVWLFSSYIGVRESKRGKYMINIHIYIYRLYTYMYTDSILMEIYMI